VNDPVVRDRVASLLVTMEVNRLTGRSGGAGGSGAKLRGGAMVKLAAELAVDLLGPEGVVGDGQWQTLFLTAPSISIRGGTDEIQRNIVGERVLGLPEEPRVDKDKPFSEVPHN
jgi:alkylation response protein AidB-like acyl-CoA dehydrogenase